MSEKAVAFCQKSCLQLLTCVLTTFLTYLQLMTCKKCRKPGEFSEGHRVCKKCRAKAGRKYYRSALVKTAKQIYYQKRREEVTGKIRFRKYGLTQKQFDELLRKQHGRCAICDETMTKVHIDHSHKTDVVRQLLCYNCNLGLGFFRDDAGIMRSAIAYIERHTR